MRLNKFSTQLLFAVSFVVSVSGILMVFHIKTSGLETVHEWVGVLFVAAIALHLINHIKPTASYFKKALTPVLIAATLAASAILYAAVPSKGSSVAAAVIHRVIDSPLTVTAPLFAITAQTALEKLRASGLTAEDDQSIGVIAQENGTEPAKIVEILSN
ncbi:hypothetical protein AGMMS49521_4290 [Campylobacterota bacterium]|nr:hypothetical protein AGMMS49521_4290 [Campylobacterota bacterium]